MSDELPSNALSNHSVLLQCPDMGKNVLKYHGVVPGSPSSVLLQTTLLLVIFVGAMSALKTEDLRLRILKGLNMTRVPHLSQLQSNISQIEFETKHREYFDLVEQNQRRRLNSTLNYDDENIVRKKLFRFTHSGLEISRSPSGGLENLNYNVYIPVDDKSYVEVEETSIRLLIVPKNCAGKRQRITLKVVTKGENGAIGEGTFEAHECLPKWVALDLVVGSGPKSDFKVSIECDACHERSIELTKPYLNVIVNVKSRLRKKRAETKSKRSRRNRNCDKIPLEVNFAKIPGYHYIVQPKSINVGLCTGRCPVRWRMSQHAILQHLVSKSNTTVPKPCCSPSKMEGLEYLYLNEHDSSKLKVGFWNDTIVLECRCS